MKTLSGKHLIENKFGFAFPKPIFKVPKNQRTYNLRNMVKTVHHTFFLKKPAKYQEGYPQPI